MKCEGCGAIVPEDQISVIQTASYGEQKVCSDCADAFYFCVEH